jgi:predicted signal transduction protein with EAL and GGDEF domain
VLAIDDFGTGNSSLSWLEKLRPDVLKIDKSFTSAIGIDSVNATVTDIIIALAHRLNIVTVAEGVETQGRTNICGATASISCRDFIMPGRCRWKTFRSGWRPDVRSRRGG